MIRKATPETSATWSARWMRSLGVHSVEGVRPIDENKEIEGINSV